MLFRVQAMEATQKVVQSQHQDFSDAGTGPYNMTHEIHLMTKKIG